MHEIVLMTIGENEVRKKICEIFSHPVIIQCEKGKKESLLRLEELLNEGVKVLLTYRCPYIIPVELYSQAARGAYNIHPSLLPEYAGLNPWPQIFQDKVRHSGVTLHRIDDIPDSGEIIATARFEISADDTIDSARVKADDAAVELLEYL